MSVLNLLARVPLPIWYVLAPPAAFFIRRVVRYRLRQVRTNLQRALPEHDAAARAGIERAFYLNMVQVAFEAIRGARMRESELLARVEVVNPEVFADCCEQGQPVLIVGAHQANWEWFLLACSLQLPLPLEVIYRPLHDTWFERFSAASRTRFGARLIADRDAIKSVMANHKTLRALSMVADQRPGRKEPRYWTEFLNQDTAFHTGWAKIAQFTKYPVFHAHCQRVGRGRYQVVFKAILKPPYPRKVDDMVETYARELEASIKKDPSTWLWSHQRWREAKPLYE